VTPYARLIGDITVDDLRALEVAKAFLRELPEEPHRSCHYVARKLVPSVGGKVEDGYFGQVGWEHSWIVLPSGNILDAYPIAAAEPFLVVTGGKTAITTPWDELYIKARIEAAEAV
jgi:hypothetical protein